MDMCMGDFQAHDRNANPFAGIYALDGLRNNLGENPESHILIVTNIKQVIGFPFWDDQHVPFGERIDRKSTRLNSSHVKISYAVFCLKKKMNMQRGRD